MPADCKTFTLSTITMCFLLLLSAGCVMGPRSTEQSPYAGMVKSAPIASVSTFTPDIAHIHVNRPSAFYGILASTPIKFNGRKVGKLVSGSSLDQFVTPGQLQISADYSLKPFDLVVKGGHKYLIDVLLKGGRFELVSDVLIAPRQEPEPPAVTQTGPAVVQPDELDIVEPSPAADQADKPVAISAPSTLESTTTTDQVFTTQPPIQTGPGELLGKVIGIDGRIVRIVMESGMRPTVGDTVRIGQSMPGFDGLIFMAGEWTVTKITSNYVLAEAGADVSGTPGQDYIAIIRSASPQSR